MKIEDFKDGRLKNEFLKEYSKISGKDICDCSHRYSEYLEDYNKLINTMSSYKLKDGVCVYVISMHMHVSNSNLTDEIAEKMIGIAPSYRKLFSVIPEPKLPELSYEEKLISVNGIGKATARKIMKLHADEISLKRAIENGKDTGADESYNQLILEVLG